MTPLTLSLPEFSIFASLVEERAGLAYTLADKPIFESKLWGRALDAGFQSALDYYYFLRYDDPSGAELDALVRALLVHETFFFRELDALRAVVTHFIAPQVRAGGRARIWCAACSTGEEPFTMAMLLASMGLLSHVELMASDLSDTALERAQAGKFGSRALRQKCPPWAEPYLTKGESGFIIADHVREAVRFRKINLIERGSVESMGLFDLILCRNVLIYFADPTASKVVLSLKQQLVTGGTLLVGVSESLMRFDTGLSCEEHGGTFVYRKHAP